MKGPVQRLSTHRHRVYQLAPGLLLAFKPRGHREAAHTHAHRQRLRVLRGALRVRVGMRTCTLRPGSRPLSIAAGRLHETFALRDTWVVAEYSEPKEPRQRLRS
jgi:quercetin dioxygenase-like cupin family protein